MLVDWFWSSLALSILVLQRKVGSFALLVIGFLGSTGA